MGDYIIIGNDKQPKKFNLFSPNQDNKTRFALIGIAVAFVVLTVTISIFGVVLANNKEAKIANESSRSVNQSEQVEQGAQTEQITDKDLTRVKKSLYELLRYTNAANHKFDANVRWDTIEKEEASYYPTTSFLVDVDEYQQTYRVTLDEQRVAISCPEIGESKYPSSFCIGNNDNFDDSISLVFGSRLPYQGETSAGKEFVITRSEDAENPEDRYLVISMASCSDNEGVQGRVDQAVDELLTSLGAPTDLFRRSYLNYGCNHSDKD